MLERLEQIEAGKAVPAPAKPSPGRKRRSLVVGLAATCLLTALLGGLVIAFLSSSETPTRSSESDVAVGFGVDWPKANQQGAYLTDLKPAEQVNWYPYAPRSPKKKPKGPDDQGKGPDDEEKKAPKGTSDPSPGTPVPVRVKGQAWPHGIFMHGVPPHLGGGASIIRYRLDKQYRTFHALVTLNDGPSSSEAPMTFTVFADGKQIWQSTPVELQEHAQRVELSMQGVEVLTIQMECPEGHVRGAHGVWVEPFVGK